MPRKIVKSKVFVEEAAEETLAEVPAEGAEPLGPAGELQWVGRPVERIDGYDKVSGTAVYAFDKTLPRMAHARTLRCPHPHARVKSIDTAPALAHRGVLDVITHENAPKISWYYGTTFLFDPELRYEGDEVACVVAETEQIAEDALRMIAVEYETLPFVAEAAEAVRAGAPEVHAGGNIVSGQPARYERGDVAAGRAAAAAIVEETYSTQVAVHNPLECHGSVAGWDGDRLTIWDSTQGVFAVRDTVAGSLGIPADKVRVIKKYMGGGFGSKLEAGKYTVMAALLAQRIGRPVRITLDRREMNLAVGNRPDSVQKLAAGALADGTLTFLTHESYGAVGAHPGSAGCSWPLRTLYACPNVHAVESSVYINAGRCRPFRAPGHVQGTFALESILDELAEKLGLDPLDLRLKNHAAVDQVMNLPYTSKRLAEACRRGAAAIGWERRARPAGSGPGPLKRGIGMACQIWWGGGGPPAYATLKLNSDGTARVLAGTQDIGTGTYTFIAQVAAETLEIPIASVGVTLGDTEACPYCGVSGGSMTAPSVAPAVRDAALQIKAKLMSGAAALLQVPEERLRYAGGMITDADDPARKTDIAGVVRGTREQMLIATGARNANPEGYAINSFGAQFADVEVDVATGAVRVVKIVAAHDVGRVLNAKTLLNQFHGGIIQGLSFGLMERRILDKSTGKVLTAHLHDYKPPTIMDAPEIEVIIVSDSDPLISSVGAKGVGEPAIIPTAAAIANAVYNAIGVRIRSLPITPDKVLAARAG